MLALSILALAGCAALPFPPVERVPMPSHEPAEVIARFAESIPAQAKLLSSVTFRFGPQEIAGIGVLEFDEAAGTFGVACMNPMGMKLFELEGTGDAIKMRFILPLIDRGGGFGQRVGEDIRRMYFGLVPSACGYWSRWDGEALEVSERTDGGVMRYTFAGADGALIEKAFFTNDDDLRWRVLYFGYERKNAKLFARDVVFQNYQYGYSLTVRVKEILD